MSNGVKVSIRTDLTFKETEMKYSGIDLHSNNSVVVVTDEADRVLLSKRLANKLKAILEVLAPHRNEIVGIVVESTYNWYWLVDGLQEAGYRVHLANTAAIRQYDGLKHGNDTSDAAHLAHLLRLNILPTGHIMPKAERAVRDLARKRMQLVRSRTTHILAVENVFARNTAMPLNSSAVKRFTAQDVARFGLEPDVMLAIQANVAVIGTLNTQIEALEQRLQERVRPQANYTLLKSVPGIGEMLATAIMLETGTIERFAAAGNYSSYCRCVDSTRVSNGKKKGEGNVKNGNKYLAWAFIEAAHYAIRFCVQVKRFYERKKAKRNAIVALKAVAHKLSRACYHIMREGKPFDVARCFG
jgi:transposase